MPRWRLLAITVIAFAGFVPSAAAAVPFDDKHFIAAIHDASVPQRTEIDTALFELSDANQRLVWRPGSGRQQLAVAALMTVENYRQFYASGSGTTPSSRPVVWVTLAPELRAWCRSFARRLARDGKRNPTLVRKRVAQRLGLSPQPRYTRVVELWVDRSNVFRPCPDPEPTDRRCELQMQGAPQVKGTVDYPSFFAALYVGAYATTGAPWTRLGYTYDWGASNNFGASEYMLTTSTSYEVKSASTLTDYCQ